MLAGLGRWLRIAGYGTAIAERVRRDRDLVHQAHMRAEFYSLATGASSKSVMRTTARSFLKATTSTLALRSLPSVSPSTAHSSR
jgi:uncharacterized protein with PIN domain